MSFIRTYVDEYTHKAKFLGRKAFCKSIKNFSRVSTTPCLVQPNDHIVIVGIGVAAFTLLKRLKTRGFERVTIVAADEDYGGKCVNYGCMPTAYFHAHILQHPEVANLQQATREFAQNLRLMVRQQFDALSYPVVQGTAREIKGKTLFLTSGETIDFDRLVLATGSYGDVPAVLGETESLASFWTLEAGRLVIVSDQQLTSLSYAEMAADMGLEVSVLFLGNALPLQVPSMQYFMREIEKQGIEITEGVHIHSREGGRLFYTANGSRQSTPFDFLFYNGHPQPRLLPIEGKPIRLFDIDFAHATIRDRADIAVLGEAGGFLSAAEAEWHAIRLFDAWTTGSRISLRESFQLPARLHAHKPLALVGEPLTLLRQHWQSIDFGRLGWNQISEGSGRLWYRYNAKTRKVEAIHICHRDATELINIAAGLIAFPVHDPVWITSSIHPSGAEIFKLIVEDIACGDGGATAPSLPAPKATSLCQAGFKLPRRLDFDSDDFLADTFTEEEKKIGHLEKGPRLYFALLLGIKCLSNPEHRRQTLLLKKSVGEQYTWVNGGDFAYEEYADRTRIRLAEKEIDIYL